MTDQPVIHTYRLYHRLLSYSRDVRATSAQEACEKLGWLIGDVWVSCLGPAKHPSELPPERMKGE
ncbi:MAG: hypothetical protein DDT36_01662 [Firmicutes bacterium]|nr:hypothetical protein [Bacillota bacterium]MBT9161085.1 hypothetical protein [Chloroflexota bacterium]